MSKLMFESTLQILFKTAKSAEGLSANYICISCLSWSVNDMLLCVLTADGMRYYPLVNIESFRPMAQEDL